MQFCSSRASLLNNRPDYILAFGKPWQVQFCPGNVRRVIE